MILFFLILAQAPSFTLEALDKNEVVLDSLLKKGPVVLGFWATWCKYCVKELGTFEKLNKEFGVCPDTERVESVTFVAINEDGPRTQRRVPIMVKSRGWNFLILYDNDRAVMRLFQVRALPHTFIIGKGREILYQHIGFRKKDDEVLRKELQSLLKESKDSD